MPIAIVLTRLDAWGEIAVDRDADFTIALEFARAVRTLMAGGGRVAVVDLRHAEVIDAAFTRELYGVREALGGIGGDLIVVATHPAVLRVLETVSTHDPLTVVRSRDEAFALARAAVAEGGSP